MLNVTYLYGLYLPSDGGVIIPSQTRIMTDILNNQKKLNVHYSNLYIKSLLSWKEVLKHEICYNDFLYHFINEKIDEIKTEYVLLTLLTIPDVILAINLLKRGKKVVVGGPIPKQYTIDQLLNYFKYNSNGEYINLNNLLIIRTYINKTANLYQMIKDWNHVDVDRQYDLSSIYETSDDCFLDNIPYFKKWNIRYTGLSQQITTVCSWNKCKFCVYHNTPLPYNFLSEDKVEKVANESLKLLEKYQLNSIYFGDPEFRFNKTNRKYLDILKYYGVKINILASIHDLLDDRYFNYVFKEYSSIITKILIGIECANDSMLKLINKNQNVQQIFEITKKIVKHNSQLNKPICVKNLLMTEIVAENREQIINNYNNLFILKNMYDEANLPHTMDFGKLTITYSNIEKYCNNNPYVKIISKNPISLIYEYVRVDKKGNFLPDDIDIIGEDNFNNLSSYKSMRFLGSKKHYR